MATVTCELGRALSFVEAYAGAKSAPALDDAAVSECLDGALVADSAGRGPADPLYRPTWNLEYAVSLAFERKAAAVLSSDGVITGFTSEGSSVSRSGQAAASDFVDAAARWRSRATGGGGLSVIELTSSTPYPVPRSAHWGETPDDWEVPRVI